MFKQIILDLKSEEPKEKIAYRFHLSVAEVARKTCLVIRKKHNVNKVVLSGGVFQNNLLSRLSRDLLRREDFEIITHNDLASNDSGISLGQAAIGNFRSQ